MSKTMQNLVVLMEPFEDADNVSVNTGNMLFNRFSVDEDAAFELSVYYLEKASRDMMYTENLEFEEKRKVKGKRSCF